MTAEDSGGASNSILRLTDNLASSNANTDITFAGAGGLVISRTDANTLLFTQGDAGGGDYSDTEAKAAAGAALAQGTHASINGGTVGFAYNSVNKTIGMTLTGATSNQNTTYDLLGRNTTTNEAYIDLKDSNNVTDSIHFQGSNGTTISWDDTYKRITIDSATVTTPDWNVNGGTSANPTGTAGGILNKPTLSDVGQTGKLSDSTDLKNTSANDGDRLKYVSSTQKWTPTTNNLADLSNVSNATPADGQVLKWDDTNSIWKPDTDESGTTGSTAFKGLSDTPNDYTSYAGKFLKVNSAENGLEFTDAAGASTIEDVNNTSSSIANNAYAELDITGQTVYTLFKIKASVASWVRLYVDDASRNLDATRSEGEDPLPGSGVVAEVRTTGANQEVLITPGVMGFNNDSPTRTKKIYVAINNRSGSATTVTVTLTILKLG